MTFPKRKRAPSSANPFGRKLSPEDASARDAPRSVQQSLFSAIRGVGYEGGPASSIAWRLIKAVRPAMAESALSLRQVSACPIEELEELRSCAVTCSNRESMASEPTRAELVGDIIAMLDGLISRIAGPEEDETSLEYRRGRRAAEIMSAEGLAIAAALARANTEIVS